MVAILISASKLISIVLVRACRLYSAAKLDRRLFDMLLCRPDYDQFTPFTEDPSAGILHAVGGLHRGAIAHHKSAS